MPRAVHAGNYGLMQIRLGTARGVGYSRRRRRPARSRHQSDLCGEVSRRRLSRGGMRRRPRGVVLPARLLRRAQRECASRRRRCCSRASGARWRRQARAAAAKPTHAAPKPADVIKPKVVRTETIATSKSGPAPARPVGNFRAGARCAAAGRRPRRLRRRSTPARSRPSTPTRADAGRCRARREVRAGLGAAAAGAARARAGAEAATSKPRSRRASQSARHEARRARRPRPIARSKTDDPAGVVSFLKKLVTPDKKPRKRTVGGGSRSAVARAAAAVNSAARLE